MAPPLVGDEKRRRIILYVLNEAYFFLSHRIQLAEKALEAGFDVHMAAPADHAWAPAGFNIAEIESRGIRCHAISLSRRGQNPFQELKSIFSIWLLIRRTKPDLIHFLTIKPILYGGLITRMTGHAAVFGLTGLGYVFSARGLLAQIRCAVVEGLMRIVFGAPRSRVIVQNHGDWRLLVDRAIVDRDSVYVIVGSGVDLGVFSYAPVVQKGDRRVVTLAGRLIWDKGVREFVEAARIVRRRLPNIEFRLVGDTKPENPRSVPIEQLKAWADEGVVKWEGHRSDMVQVLHEADIVCLPTLYAEGVPKVLLEAAACGRCIVASDTPGCREVVTPDVNGLLIAPGDVPSLVGALEQLLGDTERCVQMGREGARLANDSFGSDTVVAETIALYDTLLRPGTN